MLKNALSCIILTWGLFSAFAQTEKMSLEEFSQKFNKSLPEKYDHLTKLQSTSVLNQCFYLNFIVQITPDEYQQTFPNVKAQILKNICTQAREKTLLKSYRANLVYRYENHKGQHLGEFTIRPEFCR